MFSLLSELTISPCDVDLTELLDAACQSFLSQNYTEFRYNETPDEFLFRIIRTRRLMYETRRGVEREIKDLQEKEVMSEEEGAENKKKGAEPEETVDYEEKIAELTAKIAQQKRDEDDFLERYRTVRPDIYKLATAPQSSKSLEIFGRYKIHFRAMDEMKVPSLKAKFFGEYGGVSDSSKLFKDNDMTH